MLASPVWPLNYMERPFQHLLYILDRQTWEIMVTPRTQGDTTNKTNTVTHDEYCFPNPHMSVVYTSDTELIIRLTLWLSGGLLESVTVTNDIAWMVLESVTVTNHIAWTLLESVTITNNIAWRLLESVTVTNDIGWRPLESVIVTSGSTCLMEPRDDP
jgi:hypothetical protein